MAHKASGGKARVFALDTGRLPDETYMTAERVRAKYGVEIEWFFPAQAPVENLIRLKGLYSFRDSLDDRHECCGIRKVEPLGRALAGLDAWITGLRREQSVTRTEAAEVELDGTHGGIAKVNPIIAWSADQVRAYAVEHRVPIHPLHDKGYPSIGCAPCTRAVAPGEHPRAGRWWWENPENKECGLHVGGAAR
jgi:phosphoadenosine phosphosulfate reductase